MPSIRRSITQLTTVLILCGAASAFGATLHVPSTHGTLRAALEAARPGDVIEIAPGTYAEHDLDVAVSVTIRGLGERAADVVFDARGQGRILACESVSGTVTVQNVTFRGGNPQGTSTRQRSGGALFVSRSVVVVQNCRFVQNTAAAHGGAIRFVAAEGRVSQSEFVGNRATFGGGAIDCSYGSSPALDRSTFRDNEGGWGGAVSCRVESSPAIDRCAFTGNVTTSRFGYGGGVFADLASAPRLTSCTLTGNRAAFGGALGCFQGSQVVIEHCTVAGNTALGSGAGVYCIDGSPRLTASIVAFQQGSGVESIGLALPELGCSNIYSNMGGDVNGPATGVAGAEPVIYADPGFCTDDPAAGGALVVASGAPGTASSCGPMGAWPSGCDLAAPTVSAFALAARGGATVVTWSTEGDHPGASYRLTWSRDGDPEREIVVEQTAEDAFTGTTSAPAVGDEDVVFRVYVNEHGGGWAKLAETGYGEDVQELPTLAEIGPVSNWPNPFNPATTIGVTVGRAQRLRVAVYNLDGRRVRSLADRVFAAGEEELPWDGRDDRGQIVASGTYVVRVSGERDDRAHKITLLK